MLFPSFTFILAFLPVTAILYFLLGKYSRNAARIWLLAASFVFYSWFNHTYFLILLGSILGNYLFASVLWKHRSKITLIIGIVLNILLLGYFKYCDFFIENINAALDLSIPFQKIILPLGISFFTFQQISFLHSVYSRSLKERYSFLTYATFVSFFPQLIAGPIVLPDEMMPQFDKPDSLKVNAQNISTGLFVFALGLSKKILLADFFAETADAGFAAGANGALLDSWLTALAYTFQIYFDFSGYCDMAIGIALIFNIRLPENFNSPYRSGNIAEFWRKWHITLGRFLMTYIYFPIGGSKAGKFRTCCNLMITFLISGLWHGASWLFVLWGAVHGIALVIQRVWSKMLNLTMPAVCGKMLTFLFVCLAWILFRAENMTQAKALYRAMFAPEKWIAQLPDGKTIILFIAGIIIVAFFPTASSRADHFKPTLVNALIAIALIVTSMFFFVKTSPFIYFNF